MVKEGELLERWGIETVPITLVDIEKGVLDMVKTDKRVKDVVADFKARGINFKDMDEKSIRQKLQNRQKLQAYTLILSSG